MFRVKGRVGQIDDPENKDHNKWIFEIFLTALGAGDKLASLGQFGPWASEEEAHAELKKACQMVCETVEMTMTGTKSGKFIDMKTNETKEWGKDEPKREYTDGRQ